MGYEQIEPWPLAEVWAEGAPLSCRLGNRSAVEWVVDQYRVKIDSRTGVETARIVSNLPAEYAAA